MFKNGKDVQVGISSFGEKIEYAEKALLFGEYSDKMSDKKSICMARLKKKKRSSVSVYNMDFRLGRIQQEKLISSTGAGEKCAALLPISIYGADGNEKRLQKILHPEQKRQRQMKVPLASAGPVLHNKTKKPRKTS